MKLSLLKLIYILWIYDKYMLLVHMVVQDGLLTYTPTALTQSPLFSTSLPNLLSFIFLKLAILRHVVIPHCDFNLHFPGEVKHFFVYLSAICKHFLENYLFRFFVIFKLLFLFWLLRCLIPCIFWILTSYQMYDL
jgi:hypothetical protein